MSFDTIEQSVKLRSKAKNAKQTVDDTITSFEFINSRRNNYGAMTFSDILNDVKIRMHHIEGVKCLKNC
jgi:hypothetical protein